MQLLPQPMKDFVDLRRISPDSYATAFRNQLHQEKLLFKRKTRLFEVRQNVFECFHSPSPLQALLDPLGVKQSAVEIIPRYGVLLFNQILSKSFRSPIRRVLT